MAPSNPVVIVGAANIDEIVKLQDPLQPGESNRVRSSSSIGGVAANVACAASHSCPVVLIAAIAADSSGHLIHAKLAQSAMDFCPIESNSHASGRYVAVLDQAGELVLGLANTEIAESVSAMEILPVVETISTPVSMLVLDANLSPSCIKDLCASHPSTPIIAIGVSPVKTMRFASYGAHIEILFVNRHEAAMLCNADASADLHALSNILFDMQFSRQVITDGASPIFARDGTATEYVQVCDIPIAAAVSVSGAGDALAGATIAGLNNGASLIDAVKQFGVAAAQACLIETYSDLSVNHLHSGGL